MENVDSMKGNEITEAVNIEEGQVIKETSSGVKIVIGKKGKLTVDRPQLTSQQEHDLDVLQTQPQLLTRKGSTSSKGKGNKHGYALKSRGNVKLIGTKEHDIMHNSDDGLLTLMVRLMAQVINGTYDVTSKKNDTIKGL